MAITKSKRLEQLEQECRERGVTVIYDDLRSEGGLCRLRGSFFLILNRRLAPETKARVITDALVRMQAMAENRPEAQRDVPVPAPANAPEVPVSLPQSAETAPALATYPEPEFLETEAGVPVASGVPDSQN